MIRKPRSALKATDSPHVGFRIGVLALSYIGGKKSGAMSFAGGLRVSYLYFVSTVPPLRTGYEAVVEREAQHEPTH